MEPNEDLYCFATTVWWETRFDQATESSQSLNVLTHLRDHWFCSLPIWVPRQRIAALEEELSNVQLDDD